MGDILGQVEGISFGLGLGIGLGLKCSYIYGFN